MRRKELMNVARDGRSIQLHLSMVETKGVDGEADP
jgi:hypothetical protein